MAETNGLLNRRRVNSLPRVRISPSPPKPIEIIVLFLALVRPSGSPSGFLRRISANLCDQPRTGCDETQPQPTSRFETRCAAGSQQLNTAPPSLEHALDLDMLAERRDRQRRSPARGPAGDGPARHRLVSLSVKSRGAVAGNALTPAFHVKRRGLELHSVSEKVLSTAG